MPKVTAHLPPLLPASGVVRLSDSEELSATELQHTPEPLVSCLLRNPTPSHSFHSVVVCNVPVCEWNPLSADACMFVLNIVVRLIRFDQQHHFWV